jgi:uncharacterized protein YciI
MLFVWLGFLKEGADADQQVQQQATSFLQQPYISILSAGALRDEGGRRAGMMMIFEVENRGAAEALVAGSPYLNAGLYETHHLLEFRDEIG